jgi:membrane-associated phospholipid phosphatase
MGLINLAERGLSSRPLWSGAMSAVLVAGVAAAQAAQPFDYINLPQQLPTRIEVTPSLNVARWKTWVLTSGSEVRPAAPPKDRSPQTLAELSELGKLQGERDSNDLAAIQYWNSVPATTRWSELALSLIKRDKTNPVRAARVLGCLHTAMYDAVVASYDAKGAYRRLPPYLTTRGLRPAVPVDVGSSYPSEHAAVAAAAAGMLGNLFPADAASFAALEKDACESRLLAGANYRSDVEVGTALGKAIAARGIARAAADGASAQFAGTLPTGPGLWFGPNPLEPLAGAWKTWIMTSGSQLRPGPPPAFGSAEYQAALAEVKRVCNNATPSQRAIALFWADGAGTATPPGHWAEIAMSLIARDRLSTPAAARIMALQGAAAADAAISCWDTKYQYMLIRPVQADPTITTIVPTPPFPSYTSGHSTFSGSASEVLAYFFPRDAARLRAMAEEAAVSRLFGGIHYRFDNEAGMQVGRRLGALAIQRDRLNTR